MALRGALHLVTVLLVGACGAQGPSPSPADTPAASGATELTAAPVQPPPIDAQVAEACQFGAVHFDVGPVAFCTKAVALAAARLDVLHWPITSTTFRLSLCPPNARCRAPADVTTEGWVIFTFSAGEPVMIHVATVQILGLSSGNLVASDPEPVPAWLLAELAPRP